MKLFKAPPSPAAWLCGKLVKERLSAGALPQHAAQGVRPSWCAPAAEMRYLLPLESKALFR